MKPFARPLILLLLIIVGNTLHTVAQSDARIDSIKKTGSGAISGKVTIKGKAASNITVVLRNSAVNNNDGILQKVTTDEEGIYQLTNVAPGSYQVVPIAPTHVITGQSDLDAFRGLYGSKGKPLVIAERETVKDVDFALIPGGVITGKVTDSAGRPLVEEQINLTPVADNDPSKRGYPSQLRLSITDDRGIYRIFGLPKGRYLVSIGRRQGGVLDGGPRRSRFRQTFHPAVNDASKATIIEVSEGSEATNVDITVSLDPANDTFSVSGRIVDASTSQPLPNVTPALALQTTAGGGSSSMTSFDWKSNPLGEFKLENVTPGKYAIHVADQFNSQFRAEPVPVEVVNQDVTGVVIKAVRGASVAGVISFESGNAKPDGIRLDQLFLQLFLQTQSINGGYGRSVNVSSDGSFRVDGLDAGIAHFTVTPNDDSRGLRIIRVEREGVVQSRGIEIKDGESVTGIRLVVRYGKGTVRGIIRAENGELPTPPALAVWLSNPGEDGTNPMGTFFSVQPEIDSRGHFLIENLPAGDYEVNASVFTPRGRVTAKQQVNVADGVVAEVTLTLNLKPN